jgi:hypothetical protein
MAMLAMTILVRFWVLYWGIGKAPERLLFWVGYICPMGVLYDHTDTLCL